MKKILVTGGTGSVGYPIIKKLLAVKNNDFTVAAFVRSKEKALSLFLDDEVELIEGDLCDYKSIDSAMKSVTDVFHTAGIPEQWLKDKSLFYKTNVLGTQNFLKAALKHNVKKFVYTSTIDVFAAKKDQSYDESKIDEAPKNTYYERSKQQADTIAASYLSKGLNVIFIHPSGIYGPGVASSSDLNKLFIDVLNGKKPLLTKGGIPVVFNDDVANGHILAWQKGTAGGRYILSDQYYPMKDIVRKIAKVSSKKIKVFHLPWSMAWLVAYAGECLASLINKPPLLSIGNLHFLNWQAKPIALKAQKELGWQVTSFEHGLKKLFANTKT